MNTAKLLAGLLGLLVLPWIASGQDAIRPGTVLPVRLQSSLSSKVAPGTKITAKVMQDVPLENGKVIRRGTTVVGHIDAVTPASEGSPRISLKFDQLVLSDRTIPISTNLQAIASLGEIEEAQIPKAGPDEGTPHCACTTHQVGGDVVYRGGGHVMRGTQVVGEPAPDGVLTLVHAPGELPQAMWIFSVGARGAYGFSGLTIVDDNRSNTPGQITLDSDGHPLRIPSGSGLLLRVVGSMEKTS